ncbi:hypothetical protein GALMADRAFT_154336 [Galerina marginata CBS 339.88]|uniref:F-box domain-containing protein n=1 Tax=Galerina marginata (strain CBS 339.88) TaxID=685588 RepID=A0A067TKI7_GALM3|nr:hypothetical protein GALMADRAFT_154336 [Galerina marginata CBS 339.88]
MSAELGRNRNHTHNRAIHSTPPEVWSTIFRLAVGEHLCEDQFTSSEGLRLAGGPDEKQWEAFRMSLVTRRYIIRVSKAWYEMASPLLNEYILLRRGRSTFLLRDAMEASRRLSETNGGERPIGWWTKRLDVLMRDDGTTTDFDPYLVLDAVADIIACLPNLRILTFFVIGNGYAVKKIVAGLPSKVLCSLCCRESLKVVHWYNGILLPKVDDWTSFLQNHPYLESVHCDKWPDISPNTNLKLPSLKIVYPAYKYHHKSHYDFMHLELPAVRFAVYDKCNMDLLSQLGEQLTVLQIEKSVTETYGPHDQALFAEIREKCANLLQVNLIGFLLPDISFPSTVRVLGLDIVNAMSGRGGARYAVIALPSILSQNPNLKVVRLLSDLITSDLKFYPRMLIKVVKQMENSGVILLDHEDCPIRVHTISSSPDHHQFHQSGMLQLSAE